MWGLSLGELWKSHLTWRVPFSLRRCSAVLEAGARHSSVHTLATCHPCTWAGDAAPSCGWVSMFPSIFFFFFFFANCLFALAYLLLVHELSHPTSNILVCSLALWHFSLNPFQTQGVSSYVALTNKIKTPWERSCLKRYFFLSLSFSPWVLLKVWYRRGDITIFKRKPFCDKCFLPGILKTWKLLWGPIEKEILLVVLDGKKTKWYIEGGFYSFTMLSGRFCFNMLITFILVEKPIVSLWTRWMNCKIDVKK